MKKILILFVVSLSILSCSKDDDKNEVPSLNGTSWVYNDGIATQTLRFSSLDCTLTIIVGTSFTARGYAYDYKHPIVTLYPKESGMATMRGTISEDKMTLVNTSTGKTTWVMTKQ